MNSLTQLSSLATALPLENIDTDQLIPARFMKESRAQGYGGFLLHDMRYNRDGSPRDFILNHAEAQSSQVLVARRNFGAGSSREAAVYALVDFGFRCVIAPSFGDIFASNAVNNGLLPALVSEQDCEHLLELLSSSAVPLCIDLATQIIKVSEKRIRFDINPTWKLKLLNGWDDIDLTLAEQSNIDSFRERYLKRYPWL
ncbi:3-isopropylmalate dehydratase small subunit [Granulosicoccus antarcticus]|uniref:3-isopropylmalate dehydratase n=1 Tax=Granulosicoccus antarcticus IMCC3135 TaxID=1192854 RepID=A0A2Z2P2L2_9GAMM|nr:3-isopropylmalate dehydratase small subunit [Granulosicoccus antarcticus]ASJ73934.1 3-isopropylmalate dehydratase small subunit 1 [Granulosicoccus antarcticus IMCC3135]